MIARARSLPGSLKVALVIALSVALLPLTAASSAAATTGYRDVLPKYQFYREISWLAAEGITTGYSDHWFRPEWSVSREAFAAFLYRLDGSPKVVAPSKSPFRDVKSHDQFYKQIVWLEKTNITTGWSDKTFRPDQPISRSAMAAFLYRYDRYDGEAAYSAPKRSPFKDMKTSSKFFREVAWLAHSGMTTGFSDGTFRPYASTSRAATAAFLFRGYGSSSYKAPKYVAPPGWDPSRDVTKLLKDPESILVVVNKSRPLKPANYTPPGLVAVSGVPGGSSQRMRREAAAALKSMYKGAAAQGLSFSVASSYRSYATQRNLFNSYVSRYGVSSAETFSARPSFSEHQTGWTADLSDGGGCRISKCFGDTTVGHWVAKNAYKYGFVIRYPAGKTHITGYIYEPWHVRYVGTDLSSYMHGAGITTLEEQFDLPGAPNYN